MRTAVYGASLDLLTNGHLWVINEGAKLFDRLTVAVADNPAKKYMFTMDERMKMARDACMSFSNVMVDALHDEYLVDYAQRNNVAYLVRGIRNQNDYEFERVMQTVNADICKQVSTVFLFPPDELVKVSSSMVKGLIGPRRWQQVILPYVPKSVHEIITKRFS